MNIIARSLSITLMTLASTATYAKTFKYDLLGVHSSNGAIHYPGLDFSQIKSAVLTINKDPLSPDVQINSAELTFPNAAKLLATGFKKTEFGSYRAIVNDVWIYRQVIVEIQDTDFNYAHPTPVSISVSISEKSVFIQPEDDSKGQPLLHVEGIARDITSNKVVDTESVIAEGKRLNLSLKENLSFASPEANITGTREGFVLDTLWMGKGQKTLYLPAPVPQGEFDRYTAIGLVMETVNGPEGQEYFFSVKFTDSMGGEQLTPSLPLKHLLDTAYNSGF
ncbi:hypothetical protein [Cellvibrio sp. OA-2007]|uniref:hypothetical protein n=1 Tax=Cellvibrio sp. OA-2007 TaxID=529823 RepID=UPI0007847885|nr:hypothetical protein [Cellvibrio sp. OA-2007]